MDQKGSGALLDGPSNHRAAEWQQLPPRERKDLEWVARTSHSTVREERTSVGCESEGATATGLASAACVNPVRGR